MVFILIIIAVIALALIVWVYRNFELYEITLKWGVLPVFKLKRKKDKSTDPLPPPNQPTTTINGNGNKIQVNQAPVERAIQTDNYIERQEIHNHPQPDKPPAGSALPRPKARQFVNRGKIMDDLRNALKHGSAAIVGMHGMGGVGKTELALYLAEEFKKDYPNRMLWVDVADRSLALVHNNMARSLGIKLPDNTDDKGRHATLCAAFGNERWLVILDDIRKDFPLELCLPPKPSSALITSRLQDLPGITQAFPLDVMSQEQALELLKSEGLDEIITKEPTEASELCKKCCYHPLALTLAASRLRKKISLPSPIAVFNRELIDRLKQLHRPGCPDTSDKYASLEANFALSYDDLSEENKKRWRNLAIFAASGFSLEAAAHIWQESKEKTESYLEALENASLIQVTDGKNALRYRLHDLLREYAQKQLTLDECNATQRSHAEYLIKLFEDHYTDDPGNAPQVALELDNLNDVAEWAIAKGEGVLLAQLATKPRNWFTILNLRQLWWRLLQEAKKFKIKDKQVYANVLKAIGDVQQFRKELDAALLSYKQALALFKEIGDKLGEANVLAAMSRLALRKGEVKEAGEYLKQASAIRRSIGDLYSEGADYGNFAIALLQMGQKNEAREYAVKARDIFDRIGERHLIEQAAGLIAACK